ncbi:DUF262 domain-containing protein [Rhizobium laguerreae]|uniref:DUF262 domain-containing protein n=1 Tax=Rhizobium laguerreae TaxID=1076926 RepID=UPI001C92185F|nr:DUF262 domain-containing protein [Rhizobium laguerreae]MBY3155430.1 DUF262 domain-containing protein [Rhizobium laguerreae]
MTSWFSPMSFGKQVDGTIRSLYYRLKDFRDDPSYSGLSGEARNGEWIMGFAIPPFQREHVWTDEQAIAFVNSARRGLPLGTYTFNSTMGMSEAARVDENGKVSYFGDLWLLDGMQRLTALQRFLDDEFAVEGKLWSEVDKVDQKFFLGNVHFGGYETNLVDENEMRLIYDSMNFGGTPHQEHERALPGAKR